MVGSNTNVDQYQLKECLNSTSLVSNILAKYPKLDRGPRRLKLPALTRDSKALPDSMDHIKPASWKGDVFVKNVTLLTSWNHGRCMVEEECLWTTALFQSLEQQKNISMLTPHRHFLFDLPPEDIEADDSLELQASAREPAFSTPLSSSMATQPLVPSALSPDEVTELGKARVDIKDAIIEADEHSHEPPQPTAPDTALSSLVCAVSTVASVPRVK